MEVVLIEVTLWGRWRLVNGFSGRHAKIAVSGEKSPQLPVIPTLLVASSVPAYSFISG
ncbi:hypothetical protein [Photobacterium sp. TY1-4]|uniref:hypothetical protein n=1 Tax=Photobacterium sp. TY1-4 TaxID=2899122 RepID=UPI0021BF0BD6|nr:hypothetical protein [Photobacterium sp. TY1-4]UXI03936.1 hypothetical protein NH461_17605 [Photobacterium sp. TY1-4]